MHPASKSDAERIAPAPSLFEAFPPDDAKAQAKREKAERKQLRWAATVNLISAAEALDYSRQARRRRRLAC
jgi:hypothetical protein